MSSRPRRNRRPTVAARAAICPDCENSYNAPTPSERYNTTRRFAFSLLRFLLAVTVFGAPLAAMSGNGMLGLVVGLIFAVPLAGLSLMVPP